MRMPDATFELLKKFAQRNPLPAGASGSAHEENCRRWTRKLAEQCAFTFPDQGYGCKRAGQGRPLSKDCLAQRSGGRFQGYDVMIGAGSGHPKLVTAPPDALDLGNQVFEPVDPIDHLNLGEPARPAAPSTPSDGPESGQEPSAPAGPPAIDLAPLLGEFAALHEEIAALRGEVENLKTTVDSLRTGGGGGDAQLRALFDQAGWPIEIQAGVLGRVSGWVGRKP